MNSSWHPRAKWLIATLLVSAAALLWELGADAGRVRVVVRFLAGQRVSLGSASASDSFVLFSYLSEILLLGAGGVLFLAWRGRPRGRPQVTATLVAVWWSLWVGANIVGRLVELTYRATSSLTDIRNVSLLDAADSVALAFSLLAMAVAVRRVEQRGVAHPAGSPRSRRQAGAITVVVAALIVGPLALGFVVSNGTMAASKATPTPPAAAAVWRASNASSTACPDAMFKPSVGLSAGLSSTCANLKLGSLLFTADCTQGTVPAGLSAEIFDNTGQASHLGAVAATARGCDLTTRSTSVTAAVLAGDSTGPVNEPGAVVVVADFVPSSNASGVNTVGVRVSSSSEFDVALQTGGQYAVIESTNGATPEALLQGSFRASQGGAPNLSKEVRVVVSMQGSTAAAYVDGVLLGAGPTTVPNAPGGCGFSVSTNDDSHPVVATLVGMAIFAAG
ncbi:MAG TPA: DUF4328 domain-containing protein [Candidatus Saccharimonadales bacterium]|nr:DUF4328 domain-containing protein [Candidatus Saccharimonadales bacterium]